MGQSIDLDTIYVRGQQAWSGGSSGALFHWNGVSWNAQSSPVTGQIVSVFGPSASSGSPLFGLSSSPQVTDLLLSASGASWTRSVTPPPGTGYTRLWGSSGSALWASGTNGRLSQWTGTGWNSAATPTTSQLNAVWGSGASDVWAVGAAGTVLHYSGPTPAWNKVAVPTTANLTDVYGTSPRDLWVVGESGTILHFDGSRWVAEPSGSTDALRGIWAG